jgi:hypothetical protein
MMQELINRAYDYTDYLNNTNFLTKIESYENNIYDPKKFCKMDVNLLLLYKSLNPLKYDYQDIKEIITSCTGNHNDLQKQVALLDKYILHTFEEITEFNDELDNVYGKIFEDRKMSETTISELVEGNNTKYDNIGILYENYNKPVLTDDSVNHGYSIPKDMVKFNNLLYEVIDISNYCGTILAMLMMFKYGLNENILLGNGDNLYGTAMLFKNKTIDHQHIPFINLHNEILDYVHIFDFDTVNEYMIMTVAKYKSEYYDKIVNNIYNNLIYLRQLYPERKWHKKNERVLGLYQYIELLNTAILCTTNAVELSIKLFYNIMKIETSANDNLIFATFNQMFLYKNQKIFNS